MQQKLVHLELTSDEIGQLQRQKSWTAKIAVELVVQVRMARTSRRKKNMIGSAGATVAAAEMLG